MTPSLSRLLAGCAAAAVLSLALPPAQAASTLIVRSGQGQKRTNLVARSIEPSRQPKSMPVAAPAAASAAEPVAAPLAAPAGGAGLEPDDAQPVVGTPRPAPPVSVEASPSGHPVLRALSGHLELGTRSTWFRLHKRTRNGSTFYGSIDELDAVQDYWPYKVFASYAFCPYGGLDLTWDRVEFDTITRLDGHNDGTVEMRGPILSAFGRYPNQTRFVPYGGAGIAYLFTDFHATSDWRYALRGEHSEYYGFEQEFDLKETTAWVFYLGVSAALTSHWSADLFIRRMWADIDGTHRRQVFGDLVQESDFSLPADNDAIGLGVRYVF